MTLPPKNSTQTLTVEAGFERFLTYRHAEGASPRTIEDYVAARRHWQEYSRTRGAPRELDQLEEVHVMGFVSWLRQRTHRGKSLSPQSVSHYFRTIRAFLNWTVRKGYADRDLLRDVRPPKAGYFVPQVLSLSDIQAMLVSCLNAKSRLVLVLLVDTGIRVSELVGLRYGDVNLEDGGIKVFGKGAKERIVSLSPSAVAFLEAHIRAHPAEIDAPLLTGSRGRFTPSGVQQLLRRLAKRAGIAKRVTPHILRHTFATAYMTNGGNVHGLKDELGHTTLEMARRYVHIAYGDRREVKQRASLIQQLAVVVPDLLHISSVARPVHTG